MKDKNQMDRRVSGNRSIALDLLRGITIAIMITVNAIPDFEVTPAIMKHAPWEGITIPDLAFPGFVFCMGVSAAFTINRRPNESWVGKILKRTILLFLLGMLLNSLSSVFALMFSAEYTCAMFYNDVFVHGRILGVLQRLALTYAIGMCIALCFRKGAGILIIAGILLLVSSMGYHIYCPEAPFDKMNNISVAVDYIVPGQNHIYQDYGIPFDPEGLYGTIASTASMLLGIWAGRVMQNIRQEKLRVRTLFGGGIAILLCGGLWSAFDLVGKPLWTAPFALFNAGGDMIVLALLVWMTGELPKTGAILRPFYALGRNPLFFYLASEVALNLLWTITVSPDGTPAYTWLWMNTTMGLISIPFSAVLHMILWCIIWWPVAEFMCRRNIIIKL